MAVRIPSISTILLLFADNFGFTKLYIGLEFPVGVSWILVMNDFTTDIKRRHFKHLSFKASVLVIWFFLLNRAREKTIMSIGGMKNDWLIE